MKIDKGVVAVMAAGQGALMAIIVIAFSSPVPPIGVAVSFLVGAVLGAIFSLVGQWREHRWRMIADDAVGEATSERNAAQDELDRTHAALEIAVECMARIRSRFKNEGAIKSEAWVQWNRHAVESALRGIRVGPCFYELEQAPEAAPIFRETSETENMAAAVAAEREGCAAICDAYEYESGTVLGERHAGRIGERIRARSEAAKP